MFKRSSLILLGEKSRTIEYIPILVKMFKIIKHMMKDVTILNIHK